MAKMLGRFPDANSEQVEEVIVSLRRLIVHTLEANQLFRVSKTSGGVSTLQPQLHIQSSFSYSDTCAKKVTLNTMSQ
jgi:hypothetical protein